MPTLKGIASAVSIMRPLRNRDFSLLWSGQLLSRVGDTTLSVALPWLVYDLTDSAIAMGSVVLLQNLPMLALLLVGGIAVDRFPRHWVMLASDAVRGLVTGVLALLILSGQVQLWHLQAMVVVFGAAGAFFRPAYTSVVPELVPREDLVAANSLTSGGGSLAQVCGPLLGSILVMAGGTGVAFAFDAATFGVSALCLLAMRAKGINGEAAPARAAWKELMEGVRVVRSTTWIWASILVCSIENAAGAGAYVVVLPLLVREHLGGEVGALGMLQSAVAVGTIVAMIAVAQHGMEKHRGIWFWSSIVVMGLTVLGWGLSRSIPEALALGVIFGIASSITNVSWSTSLQELVDPKLLGRVSSIDLLGSAALMPVGYMVAGAVATAAGPATVFILTGIFVVGVSGAGLLIPVTRRFN